METFILAMAVYFGICLGVTMLHLALVKNNSNNATGVLSIVIQGAFFVWAIKLL